MLNTYNKSPDREAGENGDSETAAGLDSSERAAFASPSRLHAPPVDLSGSALRSARRFLWGEPYGPPPPDQPHRRHHMPREQNGFLSSPRDMSRSDSASGYGLGRDGVFRDDAFDTEPNGPTPDTPYSASSWVRTANTLRSRFDPDAALDPIWDYLPTNKRRFVFWVVACVVTLAIALSLHKSDVGGAPAASGGAAGAGIGVSSPQPPQDGSSQEVPSQEVPSQEVPSPEVTQGVKTLTAEQQHRLNRIRQQIQSVGLRTDNGGSDVPTPQVQAIEWLAIHDERQVSPSDEYLLQRYALAVFWYSTYEVARVEDLAAPDDPTEPVANKAHNWIKTDGWMSGKGICSWYGVQCHHLGVDPTQTSYDADGMITHFNVTGNYIRGTVPPEFWKALVDMRVLDMSHNVLKGTVSDDLGKWEDLERVHLNQNFFEGTIPMTLFNPGHESKLETLDIGNNFLESTVPNNIGRLFNLRQLALYGNELTGTVPLSLTELVRLDTLYLDTNSLTGSIPAELGRMGELTDLRLRDNQLEGPIPPELADLHLLEILYLDSNNLDGEIPTVLGKLERLEELHLYENNLVGNLPSELGKLRYLQLMYIDSNHLDGSIPDTFGGLHDLKQLYLSTNELTGSIPSNIYEIEEMVELRLNNNKLSGSLPPEISQLLRLTSLHIENNLISGTLPVEMGDMDALSALKVQNNDLVGPVPDSICLLRDYSLKIFESDCEEIQCSCCTDCVSSDGPAQTGSPQVTDSSATDQQTGSPQVTDSSATDQDQASISAADRFKPIYETITQKGISDPDKLLAEPESPQFRAVDWLANVDPMRLDPDSDDSSVLLQRYALAVLWFSAHKVSEGEFEPWVDETNWMTGEGICAWHGVSCQGADGNGPVVKLELGSNGLGGTLPREIFTALSELEQLRVHDGEIAGTIPDAVGGSDRLALLDLSFNEIEGTLPLSITNCVSLSSLKLEENHLNGTIPRRISNLWQTLKVLNLRNNLLTGNIPGEIVGLQLLEELNLGKNNFTGGMPCCIHHWRSVILDENSLEGTLSANLVDEAENLEELNLGKNNFAGPLPEFPKNIRSISLNDNKFLGTLPEAVGGLDQLESLDLSFNEIEGTLPLSITNCTSLISLKLEENYLNGTIPRRISNLWQTLKVLNLRNNLLTGNIPGEIVGLQVLEEINLGKNNFTGVFYGFDPLWRSVILDENFLEGTIAANLVDAENLEELNVGKNNFVGSLPEFPKNIRSISLNDNKFSGTIPDALAGLDRLVSLDLSFNKIEGTLPLSIANCPSLSSLKMEGNFLTGAMPARISNLWQTLTVLNLRNNLLNGPIPGEVDSLQFLDELNLGKNDFTGGLPELHPHWRSVILDENRLGGTIPSLVDAESLNELNLGMNNFAGSLPELPRNIRSLFLSENALTGTIPMSYWTSSKIEDLQMSMNRLSGQIPGDMDMLHLKTIGLSLNMLTGTIPSALAMSLQLEGVSLDGNHFTGPLPEEIGKLVKLEHLHIDKNELIGTMPESVCELRQRSLEELVADCGGDSPKFVCTCCTQCN